MKITQAFTFEAAHRLPRVPETHRCHRMHGHSYRVELELEGPDDPDSGFVIDFFDIEKVFGPILLDLITTHSMTSKASKTQQRKTSLFGYGSAVHHYWRN